MAKLGTVQQDEDYQTDGRWFPWMEDIRLRIRPIDNDEYQQELRDLQEPHQQILQAAPDSEVARNITKQVVRKATARHVLVDWENVEDDDGPVTYSPEYAERLFLDPTFSHLYRFVLTQAQNERAFMLRQDRADLGN